MALINWLWGWFLRKIGFLEADAYLMAMVDAWPTAGED